MVIVILDKQFLLELSKIKDRSLKERIKNQIIKIKNNPKIGKPMRYSRKGTRELYIKPYRLSYAIKEEKIYILALYHKKHQ